MIFLLFSFLALPLIAYFFGICLIVQLPWYSPWCHFLACGVTLWYEHYWLALIFGLIGGVLLYFDPDVVHAREVSKRKEQMKEFMVARQAELEERRRAGEFAMRQINAAMERQQTEARELRQQQVRALKNERRDLGLQIDGIRKVIDKLLATAGDNPQVMQDIHRLISQIVQLQLRRDNISRRIRAC